MLLYLDDNSAHHRLLKLLRKTGHDVHLPADARLSGANDAVHLRYAIRSKRVMLTKDHKDFQELHELVLEAGGKHSGILVVRKDNNPNRDLTPNGIVRAIERLLGAGMPIENELHILNHWR
jgi:predicted nuclease of predicted toxin-antitoxin system